MQNQHDENKPAEEAKEETTTAASEQQSEAAEQPTGEQPDAEATA